MKSLVIAALVLLCVAERGLAYRCYTCTMALSDKACNTVTNCTSPTPFCGTAIGLAHVYRSGSVAAMLAALLALGVAAALFSVLDVWYFLRASMAVLWARLQPVVKDLLKEHSFSSLVLPHDLDFLLHMNNSRYLREADFARLSFFTRSGLFGAIHSLGAGMVMAACTVRYRRSLKLFEAFEIRTRLLCWDDKAFYVEQRFVAPRDGFVCAILLSRQHIIGNSPDRVVQSMCKRKVDSPEFPDEVMHWIDYNDNSSQKLRAESGIPHTKDQ